MIDITTSPNSFLIVDDIEYVNRTSEPISFQISQPEHYARLGVMGNGIAVLTIDHISDDIRTCIGQFSTTVWWVEGIDKHINGTNCISIFNQGVN